MLKGFQLNNDFLNHIDDKEIYIKIGEETKEKINTKIKQRLDEYLLPNGKIDASELQSDWFPEVGAHIFLSHSHKDRDNALILSGFLKKHFGIEVFVDSCVWGYSEELLKDINNKYNRLESGHYDYEKTLWSASNIYLMLASALNKMIDNTECIFFLNTPNSLNTSDVETTKETRTGSPWIYSEINTTQIIRERNPRKVYMESVEFQKSNDTGVDYSHKTDVSHLKEINEHHIIQWFKTRYFIGLSGYNNLDYLYKIVG